MRRFPTRQTCIFIVRMWAEYLEQTPPAWRGEVENVETREVIRFRDLKELMTYIRQACLEYQELSNRRFPP